jgi:hypothetical protein
MDKRSPPATLSGGFSSAFRSIREAVKFAAAMAAVFLIAALCAIQWLHHRGAFGTARDEHPVNLKPGSAIQVPLSVSSSADHDVAIWYSRTLSDNLERKLDGILGKATLRSGENIIAQAELPVDHTLSDQDGAAIVLFTVMMEPKNNYTLSLQVDRIPPDLTRSTAVIKTELEHLYPLIFWQVEFAATLFLSIALFCMFLLIRWWRAAAAGGHDGIASDI